MLVRIEAIMTQLVFEHALRMRVKADVSDAPMSTGNTTVAGTPDTVSLAESGSAPAREEVNNSEDDGTLSSTNTAAGETSSTQRKDKSTVSVQQSQEDSGSSIKPSEDTEYKGQNGAGKVNNLITTDLDAIAGARDIFQFGTSIWLTITILIAHMACASRASPCAAGLVHLVPLRCLGMEVSARLHLLRSFLTHAAPQCPRRYGINGAHVAPSFDSVREDPRGSRREDEKGRRTHIRPSVAAIDVYNTDRFPCTGCHRRWLSEYSSWDGVLSNRHIVAMSVIRMIKLFGWESRLSKQLSAKREDELTWIRTSRLLEVANNIAKYVYMPTLQAYAVR